MNYDFTDLILLIGTNPLPNFVVADYFLQKNSEIEKIWLIHSEENNMQAGTNNQAENLEKLVIERWKEHPCLQLPLEKISISDVSNSGIIRDEIQNKMIKKWGRLCSFHFNYTGGTKSMSTHVYWVLREIRKIEENIFSYLDARNFRLVVDNYGVIVEDLRKEVSLTFDELIMLHGFERFNQDKELDLHKASTMFERFTNPKTKDQVSEGHWLEDYISMKLEDILQNKLNNKKPVLKNWEIKKPFWPPRAKFELDVILMNGYHLTSISCTIGENKKSCKKKGFEIVYRTKQIGGDEAKTILITGADLNTTKELQEELMLDTGGTKENILVLGFEDLKTGIFIRKIDKFIS